MVNMLTPALAFPFLMNRHLTVLHRCLGPREPALLLAACVLAERPRSRFSFASLILLSRRRLIVTSEYGLCRNLRLYLNVDLRQLSDVAWSADPGRGGLRLAVTAVDGVREHFWIKLGSAERIGRIDALLRDLFDRTNGR